MDDNSRNDTDCTSKRENPLGWWWWTWLILLLLWTIGLLVPTQATQGFGLGNISYTRRFFLAKTVHVTVYLILTVLASRQRFAYRAKIWLVAVLLVHAPLAELLQFLVSNRSGRWLDVGLDYAGVFLGLIATRRIWKPK